MFINEPRSVIHMLQKTSRGNYSQALHNKRHRDTLRVEESHLSFEHEYFSGVTPGESACDLSKKAKPAGFAVDTIDFSCTGEAHKAWQDLRS